MPSLWNVSWVVENDQALNLSTSEEGGVRGPSLPAQYAEPAYVVPELGPGSPHGALLHTNDETQEFLILSGRKFRNPVILTSTGGSPANVSIVVFGSWIYV